MKNQVYPFLMEGSPKAETTINGKKYLYFGGTGYYQLQSHPEVIQAAVDATLKYGMSSATSRTIAGTTRLQLDVEKKAAAFFETEDAAYLPSGYLSNTAGIQALHSTGSFDVIFMDENAHYSLTDGANNVGKPVYCFRNNDPDDLGLQLRNHLKTGQKPLVATDGLFAIHGILANIPAYLQLIEPYDGIIWIDDSHPSGIIGPKGQGTNDFYGLKSKRLFFGSTLSKAFGGFGGIIPGCSEFINRIRAGHVMTGSTPLIHAASAASLKGIELVMKHPEMREHLWSNARLLKKGLNALGLDVGNSYFPMSAFSAGKAENMKKIHRELLKKGIFIQLTNYMGASSRMVLRIVVFSTHTAQQIEYLTDTLKKLL